MVYISLSYNYLSKSSLELSTYIGGVVVSIPGPYVLEMSLCINQKVLGSSPMQVYFFFKYKFNGPFLYGSLDVQVLYHKRGPLCVWILEESYHLCHSLLYILLIRDSNSMYLGPRYYL